MKIEHIPVSKFNVADLVKEINKRTEGRNVHGIYFEPTSLLKGVVEIRTTAFDLVVTEPVKIAKKQERKKSKYRGVSWDKGLRKWRARICVNGKRISLGLYDDEIEAAKVYDLQAIKSLGESAKTNFCYETVQFYKDGLVYLTKQEVTECTN